VIEEVGEEVVPEETIKVDSTQTLSHSDHKLQSLPTSSRRRM
jgi:hypothetical protein